MLDWLGEKIRETLLSPKRLRISDCNEGIELGSNNALWSKEDDRDVTDEFQHIRDGLIPPNFDEKLERKYNDQTVHFQNGHLFDPLEVTDKKYDLVTLSGQGRITELMTGKSNRAFTHYADGTGTSAESASDIRLQAEHFRVSMLIDGFAEPAGSSAKFAGKMPYTAPTAVISEAGVFDSSIGGVMLFRTVFPVEQRINHTQFTTFYTVSQTVSLISIT
jgi:hypothetical protein